MIKPIFLAISFLILTMGGSAAMSKAEALASIYGVILGHIDRCGLTVQPWHAEAMGRAISNAATSDADRDRALSLLRQIQNSAVKRPSMTCEETRGVLKQSEDELR